MISIIIPTYNEEDQLGRTISKLYENGIAEHITEVIIIDGGSNDNTIVVASSFGAIAIASAVKGRAAQMNYGASIAKGQVLYFLHADCIPPKGFTTEIIAALKQGFSAGCFMLQFDYKHWFLQANCWFTRFNINNFRFGDQSLFVTKEVFNKAGGFNEKLIVLEDQEIIKRIRKHSRFTVIKKAIKTSARKYILNGVYKTQAVYFLVYVMFTLGFKQTTLVTTYKSLIKQDKI